MEDQEDGCAMQGIKEMCKVADENGCKVAEATIVRKSRQMVDNSTN